MSYVADVTGSLVRGTVVAKSLLTLEGAMAGPSKR